MTDEEFIRGKLTIEEASAILHRGWSNDEERRIYNAVRAHYGSVACSVYERLINKMPCKECGSVYNDKQCT